MLAQIRDGLDLGLTQPLHDELLEPLVPFDLREEFPEQSFPAPGVELLHAIHEDHEQLAHGLLLPPRRLSRRRREMSLAQRGLHQVFFELRIVRWWWLEM